MAPNTKNSTTRKPRAGIYVRLSRDADDQTSTERQEADCRAFAKMKGYRVTGVYADVGLSGYKAVARPEYDRLIADVRAGKVDVIVIWKLDRLTRKGVREVGPLLELLDATGAQLVSVQDSFDTSTPMGEGVLGLLASMAKQESANISTRVRSAKKLAAEQGRPAGGGRRPFGYRRLVDAEGRPTAELEVDPDEAELLREAARRKLGGESLRSIAADWCARGVVTVDGAEWTSSKLGRTLRSPMHAGLRQHGDKTYPAEWPAIFTEAEHAALVDAAGYHRAAKVPNHLLSSVLRCGLCGGRMACKTTTRYGRQYACMGCSRIVVNADKLDGFVGGMVAAALDSAEVRRAIGVADQSADLDAIAAEITADRDALTELSADHYTRRLISREEFLANRQPLADRIAAAEAKVARLADEAEHSIEGDPVALWESGDLEAGRAVVRLLFDAIVIGPATVRGRGKFDTERVHPVWRV